MSDQLRESSREARPVIPNRDTENRHTDPGKTCHHFQSFGLTCDEYDELRARAAGHCEICGTPEAETTRGALVIDHFAKRGVFHVRGLLCDKCNVVMSCHDGNKPWGRNRHWEQKAKEYAASSWQQPTEDQLAILAGPWPLPKIQPEAPSRIRQPGEEIRLFPDRGVPAMARKLRCCLSHRQLARLIALLSDDPEESA